MYIHLEGEDGGRNIEAKLESCCFSLLLPVIHLMVFSKDMDALSSTLRSSIFICGQMHRPEWDLPLCHSVFLLLPLASSPVLRLPSASLTVTQLKSKPKLDNLSAGTASSAQLPRICISWGCKAELSTLAVGFLASTKLCTRWKGGNLHKQKVCFIRYKTAHVFIHEI